MGNRCVITDEENTASVYLHWNGGRDSVTAFLKYCELRGFRGIPDEYGYARLCQIIGNFFGADGLSLGVSGYKYTDCDDNGIYVVKDWKIIDRIFPPEEEQNEYDLKEMLYAIDDAQPVKHQIGHQKIDELLSKETKSD